MPNTKIAPVRVTVTFVCDEVTKLWEGREGSDLAGKLSGYLDLTKAEIVGVQAASGEQPLSAIAYIASYGKERGRLSAAVEMPGKANASVKSVKSAKSAKAPAAKAPAAKAPAAKAPAADIESRMATLEASIGQILQHLQK